MVLFQNIQFNVRDRREQKFTTFCAVNSTSYKGIAEVVMSVNQQRRLTRNAQKN